MSSIFIDIAGFNIKVDFLKSETAGLTQIYKDNFVKFLENFKSKHSKKADFMIEFCDKPYNLALSDYNTTIFVDKKKNKITNYYQDYLPFKLILENVLYILCSQNNGLIVHSSSVADNNNAYLFVAPSGGGKSTIAKFLSENLNHLADDTSIIRKIDNTYIVYQHPFIEKNDVFRSNIPYKLKAVYFLIKGKDFKSVKISNKEKILNLFIKQLTVTDEQIIKSLLSFTSTFDHFYMLNFPKNKAKITKSFMQLINNDEI